MLDLGLLILRGVVGLLFIGHGAQKLFGWFGGHGVAGTGQWLESMGMRPGRLWAILAGSAEFLGGLLLLVGLANPIGSVLIAAVMAAAIVPVHARNGLWVQRNGYEYPLVNVAAATAVALAGPGAYALDPVLGLTLPVVPVLGWGFVLIVGMAAYLGFRGGALQPSEAQN
ncbi:MAG: DoxX family protein [Armatimonadota bacterium]|nr:DoxX family protein [Armatimonadota bacterium]MDR5697690.1 DoxX family protein [Armatimonadota bacterium]